MNKILKNEKGFSAVEFLLVIIIIVLVSFAGWYVYHTDHNKTNTDSVSTTAAVNPYAGWKSFSDANFSFKFPSNWAELSPGTYGVDTPSDTTLTGPVHSTPSYMTPGGGTVGVNFAFFTSVAVPSDCAQDITCTAQVVVPLTIKGLANPKLVVFSESNNACPSGATCTPSGLAQFEVIDSTTEKVGNKTPITDGVTVDGKTYQLYGCSLATWGQSNSLGGNGVGCATINNYSTFESSVDFKNLVNVLDSLTIN